MGYAVTCWRCQLRDQLTDLLADPDGDIPGPLQPLVEALLALPHPRIAYVWIHRNAAVQTTLVLLLEQPLSRIVRLPRDAVIITDGRTALRLGRHALTYRPRLRRSFMIIWRRSAIIATRPGIAISGGRSPAYSRANRCTCSAPPQW